jgi:hypothetical protein
MVRGPPSTLNELLTADCRPGLDAINVYPLPGRVTVSPGNQPELNPVQVPEVVPFSRAPPGLLPILSWIGYEPVATACPVESSAITRREEVNGLPKETVDGLVAKRSWVAGSGVTDTAAVAFV